MTPRQLRIMDSSLKEKVIKMIKNEVRKTPILLDPNHEDFGAADLTAYELMNIQQKVQWELKTPIDSNFKIIFL